MSTGIIVENLIKSYENRVVIDNISFSVKKGEIFALLGANGAGKTTTLECIEGIRKYDSGQITINGIIGVQLQSSSLPENITAIEAFRLFSKWNNKSVKLELFDNFGLTTIKNSQYKSMSTGQKRRLHLALSLINDPEIVFLDEPTAGLDVEGRVFLHNEIRKLKAKGKTIILASHDMAEVESLCDTIAILKDGKIAFTGTPLELTGAYLSNSKIYIKTSKPLGIGALKFSQPTGFEQDYLVTVATELGDALLELLQLAKDENNKVKDIRIESSTLEQSFIQIATEGIR